MLKDNITDIPELVGKLRQTKRTVFKKVHVSKHLPLWEAGIVGLISCEDWTTEDAQTIFDEMIEEGFFERVPGGLKNAKITEFLKKEYNLIS